MAISNLRRVYGSAAVATCAAACLGVATLPALAAGGHPAGHTQAASKKFTFVTAGSTLGGKEGKQVAIVHGAIDGGGKDVAHAQSDVTYLPGGTITLTHPDKDSTFTPHVDKTTCYVTFTLTGSFTLGKGTGAYKGLTGAGTYTGHGYGYAKRTKAGACDLAGEPSAEVFQVTGTGTLD